MSYILKKIKLICIIICCFCVFDSNLLAIDYFKYFLLLMNKAYATGTTESLQKCRESKNNNFKDRSPEERIILSYLNTLLDKILSDNNKILEDFGRSPDQFCVETRTIENSAFASDGLGLIVIDIDKEYENLPYGSRDYESYILATISHEIAHDLLNHKLEILEKELEIYETSSFKNNYSKINEYNLDEQFLTIDKNEFGRSIAILESKRDNVKKQLAEFKSLMSNMDEDELGRVITFLESEINNLKEQITEYERLMSNIDEFPKKHAEWYQFYKQHPYYIKNKQSYEIEADNLGLQLYLNTGFKAHDFGKLYIIDKNNYYQNTTYDTSIPETLKTMSEKNYISKGKRAKQKGRFEEFMNSIKYEKPTDTHPSDFWRYWNARTQIEAANINLRRGIQNGLYFKIDLSKLKKLKNFKTFFSNSNNVNSSIMDENDPRVYIINRLLTSNSRSLNYTTEFFPHNRKNAGIILEDNTLLLRAHDIYIISLIKREISIIKRRIPQFNKTLSQYPANGCITLFSGLPDRVMNRLYDNFYSAIEKAFL